MTDWMVHRLLLWLAVVEPKTLFRFQVIVELQEEEDQ